MSNSIGRTGRPGAGAGPRRQGSNPYENADPIPVHRAHHRAYGSNQAAQGAETPSPRPAAHARQQRPAQAAGAQRQQPRPQQAAPQQARPQQHGPQQHMSQQHGHQRPSARPQQATATGERRVMEPARRPARQARPDGAAGRPQQAARPTAGHQPARRTQAAPRTGFVPAAGEGGARGGQAPSVRTSHGPALIGLAVVAAVVVAGVLFWTHRPVNVTVDGTPTSITVGSSLERVASEKGAGVSAGDYVSVSGKVLKAGGGDKFEATVDGNQLSYADATSYRVKGGESIDFSDGADVSEDYEVVNTTSEQPKLKMEGKGGVIFYVSQWGKPSKVETRKGAESGETADVTVQEVQDCVVTRANITPANDEKLVALTFDDGPADPYTNQYLDILEKYGAHATFFMLGPQVGEYPDAVKRVVSDGNQVGSHTWSHKQLTKLGESDLKEELSKSFSALSQAGVTTTTIRQPYGSINTNVWLYSGGQMSTAVFWSHDSEDWRRPGASQIVSNATKGMYPGAIILMHDGGGNREQDVEALPQIIEAWQNAGYRFVTISELMASDPTVPADIASGSASMPEDAVWPTEVASDSASNAIP
ncbi:MAG: polysaccharide deacetylase family protein [Atopobiaceae bacterium]|nr:polysaccharide deacetylase family protein [Olsenella sp.]MDY3901644.1 polysaccharide deacetylase family protein [Atopobiaceae bacterium]